MSCQVHITLSQKTNCVHEDFLEKLKIHVSVKKWLALFLKTCKNETTLNIKNAKSHFKKVPFIKKQKNNCIDCICTPLRRQNVLNDCIQTIG